jgi:hypothetical protein
VSGFTPQEVFDLETLLQHAHAKLGTLIVEGTSEQVTRDHLGTLHVNAAVLARTLAKLIKKLEAKHGFRS